MDVMSGQMLSLVTRVCGARRVPMMADCRGLLSFIAQRYTSDSEDVATDALALILSRSDSARGALSELLANNCDTSPIATVRSWGVAAHGAVPDLACWDDNGDLVAFIESKFWAQLTRHQPVTYWEKLPCDRPAVLLFLAPAWRGDKGSLWDELVNRLGDAGHELGCADRNNGLITALSKTCQRRLMLTSWEFLLDELAHSAKQDGCDQATFEIAELQGLAADAIKGENPKRAANLKQLVKAAIARVRRSGWANTDRLTVGSGYHLHEAKKFDFHGRYLRLGGASAWFGIDFAAAKYSDSPVWLCFYDDPNACVSLEEVRGHLGSLAEPGLEWRSKQVCLPIVLPAAGDREAVLDAMVDQLTCIAKCLDPMGPTYRDVS